MTITRIVNGQELSFELTDGELWQAYQEQELESALADLDIWLDDNELEDDMSDDQRKEVAYYFQDFLTNDWSETMDSAYRFVMGHSPKPRKPEPSDETPDLTETLSETYNQHDISKGVTTMTTSEFVRELFDSTSTSTDGITVDQAAEDIRNFRSDGWTIPDDITPEEYAAEWNHCCAEDIAARLNLYGWHEDLCEKLCDLAGLLAEYREANFGEWNDLVYQAAEKLGVTLD